MGSEGGGSGGDGMELEAGLQSSLCRQGSLYSLTLDEVQNQLGGLAGKAVGSMNLDELLRSVWSVEDNANGLSLDSSSGILNRRQSSFTLSRDVSKKTVEEVWKDIEQGKKKGGSLGEMTLEEFLVKAGVVDESQSHPEWMINYQLLPQQQQTVFLGVEKPLGQMSMADTPGGRKRSGDGVVVERRQKRMIKNRESAARSRARKQAYTHELENKVSRLEEEIERLRRHNKEKVLPSAAPPSEPKNHLRRTSSAPY